MQRIYSFARTIIGLPARRNFSGLMGLICVVALVSLNFQQVTSKGMHHTLTWGTYQDSEGMAIAMPAGRRCGWGARDNPMRSSISPAAA